MIGYVGIAEDRAAKHAVSPQSQRYEAAVFRFDGASDRTLLWVADEVVGYPGERVEGVHGGIRQDLWKANAEAIDWVSLVEEFGEASEFRAYGTFTEFEHAVNGLVGATLASVPRDLMDERNVFRERTFDLWDPALAQPAVRPD